MAVQDILRPATVEDLRDAVADAAREHRVLEARSGGSKRDLGSPGRSTSLLDLSAFAGVIDYAPSELVLTVGPATPLADIQKLLAENGQMLAFEPWDHGPLFGRPAGAATIGGIVAAGVSGPRRLSAGGARDHLLGFQGVSGRGEVFRGGGKVVKNVTGYDVSKVVAGSWGQLVVMTELTLKVVPLPRCSSTLHLTGLGPAAAIAAMAAAMGSPAGVAAAAHVPGGPGTVSVTMLRLEGFRESVEARSRQLCEDLASFGAAAHMADDTATVLWKAISEGRWAGQAGALWRAHLPPSQAAEFAARMERASGTWLLDWAGAAAWVDAPLGRDIRPDVIACSGHAMLVRAPEAMRAELRVRHPEAAAIVALSNRLKQAFDPAGILDPLRFS